MSERKTKRRRRKKGHGCIGFGVALVLALAGIFALLFFATNVLDGLKYHIYGWFYQQKYADEVERYSAEFDVDKDLVYAVIRTESGFRPDAQSSAGAVGLMQMMPSTFEWLQEKLGEEGQYTAADLKKPAVSIRYGAYFLSYLIERYGNERTALAAYNAGTTTVDGWLSDSRYSSDGKTLKKIPYSETESYVDKVLRAKEMYRKIYG